MWELVQVTASSAGTVWSHLRSCCRELVDVIKLGIVRVVTCEQEEWGVRKIHHFMTFYGLKTPVGNLENCILTVAQTVVESEMSVPFFTRWPNKDKARCCLSDDMMSAFWFSVSSVSVSHILAPHTHTHFPSLLLSRFISCPPPPFFRTNILRLAGRLLRLPPPPLLWELWPLLLIKQERWAAMWPDVPTATLYSAVWRLCWPVFTQAPWACRDPAAATLRRRLAVQPGSHRSWRKKRVLGMFFLCWSVSFYSKL